MIIMPVQGARTAMSFILFTSPGCTQQVQNFGLGIFITLGNSGRGRVRSREGKQWSTLTRQRGGVRATYSDCKPFFK